MLFAPRHRRLSEALFVPHDRPPSPRPRARERGSIVLTFALSLSVLCGFSIAALVISRQALERRELQTAADALALAGAYSLQQLGMPFHHAPAVPPAQRNSRLPLVTQLVVERRLHENRSLVRVRVAATFDSEQRWYPTRFLKLEVTAQAQVSENVYGDKWPALVFVLDASESMGYGLLGAAGTPAFEVVRQLILAYAGNTLPVRNGLVLFNNATVQAAVPPANVNNLAAITAAFNQVKKPQGLSDTRAGLQRARDQLQGMTNGRNVVLISDGEPTLGGPCAPQQPCHFAEAVKAADELRQLPQDGVALFSVEIRRTNYFPETTTFLRRVAGKPLSAGDDATMLFAAQSGLGVTLVLNGLTRSICAFGPLDPRPGSPPDALRPRPANPDPAAAPRRIFAFLREPNGVEHSLPYVPNRDLVPTQQGFEYAMNAEGAFVILTLASCNSLGADAARRLVVRWDDAQLVPPPP